MQLCLGLEESTGTCDMYKRLARCLYHSVKAIVGKSGQHGMSSSKDVVFEGFASIWMLESKACLEEVRQWTPSQMSLKVLNNL